MTLGFLPLIDCAPLAIALEEGFFKAAGLSVSLSRESSWRNVEDKVALGRLRAELLETKELNRLMSYNFV